MLTAQARHPTRNHVRAGHPSSEFGLATLRSSQVTPTCQRQGIGTRLIKALLQTVVVKRPAFYAVAWPALFWTPDIEQQSRSVSEAESIALRTRYTQHSVEF